ncbi:MAG: C40 family peptidase [Flavobacteriaceae bacterium]|nr:C40 family peptidase [Flavobacteriaceae bacterium]
MSTAKTYEGVPYKLGGETKTGIDCSALVKKAFKKAGIELPRRSVEMANRGKPIKINKVKEGDLLFFSTSGGTVNHVGIVYTVKPGGIISFIHSSSSKGVMISDLDEDYWKNTFVKAKRIT